MLRSILLIIIILNLNFSFKEVLAGYTPGNYIFMTGANNDVRFDVKAALIGFWVGAPTLDTTTPSPTFTGAFYGSGIGWIMFSTGIYQVGLDCWVQTLDNLTANCGLTGTGWNENIGEIGFWWVEYNPLTGLLEWSAYSYAGDIDMSGIALPLKPAEFNEIYIIANHTATLSISWAWIYQGWDDGWTIHYPIAWGGDKVLIESNPIFPNIDLSLASRYNISITDTNWSETTFPLDVNPWEYSMIYHGDTEAKDFCTFDAILPHPDCPDGINRLPTQLEQIPNPGPVVANGIDSYDIKLRVRDKYGNRTGSGNTIDINYETTVKYIQTDDNNHFKLLPNIDGDPFSGSTLLSGFAGSSNTPWVNLNNSFDRTYEIRSNAPTNITTNIIKLDSIIYHSGSDTSTLIPSGSALIFDPIFTVDTTFSTVEPVIGTPYGFKQTITKNGVSSITPTIISTLTIDDILDDQDPQWRNFTSIPAYICTSHPVISNTDFCNWDNLKNSSIAVQNDSDFYFTGTYIGTINANPPRYETFLKTYVHYIKDTKDILYQIDSDTIWEVTRPLQRLRLLGQSINLLNITGWENRIDLINTIRKNTTTLSRNRNNYNDVDYTITGSNINIDNSSFTDKRTIAVVGGDITITNDINSRNNPLTLVALADENGNGGNIIIHGDVKDIHSSLISERSITSSWSDNQLYIRGLVSSANAPQEVAPTTCPYYLANCTPSDFDLPGFRSSFLSLGNTTGHTSLSGAIYTAPLVIETDPRLMRNPPKIILK